MIYLVFHIGNHFGWGICAKHLSVELTQLSPVTLVTWPFSLKDTTDEFEYLLLEKISTDRDEFISRRTNPVEGPVIQAIKGDDLLPLEPRVKGKRNIGYTFFEVTSLSPDNVERARRNFDVIVSGSSWCEGVLRRNGFENTTTILQGVDRSLFNPCENKKRFFRDRFVIFSGGKFELRKGQDLVIRAFKVLQDKYDDVLLVNSWFNQWDFSMKTMEESPYLKCRIGKGDYFQVMDRVLSENGIDLTKVLTLPPKPNSVMASVYKNSDCAIFPNRCEGGTNLVLMEYMACGKPVIASNSSGHRDVITTANSIALEELKPMRLQKSDSEATWDDPDLDEIVDRLEWAYHHPDALHAIGEAAGKSMERFTWRRAAEKFFNLTRLP